MKTHKPQDIAGYLSSLSSRIFILEQELRPKGKGSVYHGSDPTVERPIWWESVEWNGDVKPDNIVPLIDTWVDSTGVF